jgi:hypothetical protein
MDLQHGPMQEGHAIWTCMQHGDKIKGMQHRHTARTWNMDIQHGHRDLDMQHGHDMQHKNGHAAYARTCSLDMEKQHGHGQNGIFLTRLYHLFSKNNASDNMSCRHVIGLVRNKLEDIYE